MRSRLIAVLAGLALAIAACGDPAGDPVGSPTDDSEADAGSAEQAGDDDTAAGDDDQGRSDAQSDGNGESAAGFSLDARCENPEDGYRIDHPGDWHANDGEVTAPCRVFDLEPPEVRPNTVLPLASAVIVTVDDRALSEVHDWLHDDPATDVHDVTETEIAGRDALRVDGTATGEAYLDDGVEVHRTHVAFDGGTVTVSANGLGDPDLDTRRAVIADMAASLEPVAPAGDDAGQDADRDGSADSPDPNVSTIDDPGREPRSGGDGRGYLTDVRIGQHDGFTRVVLEFDESVPAYEVAPTDGPVTAFPSGEQLDLAGDHHLEIVTEGTRVDLTGDEAVETYEGPLRLEGSGDPVAEAVMAGDHHGVMTWVLGLDHPADFAATDLDDPARIVVDVVADRS